MIDGCNRRKRAGADWSAWFNGLHSAERRNGNQRWLVRAKHFADRRLGGPVPIDAMAAEACVSKYHFIRAFRRIFRETPGRYVSLRRISRARELLERSDLPVTAICFEVGFESLGSFISRFKQVVGEPPGSYRQRFARHGPVIDRPMPACLYLALARGASRGQMRNSGEASRIDEG